MEKTEHTVTLRRGLLIAAAALALGLLVALPVVLFRGNEGSPVATTSAATTTAGTTVPTGESLDALGAYAAGPVPTPATCPPGSTPDVAGDSNAPRPPTPDMADSVAAFDRQSGLLVLRGGTSTWVFDPCRNRWEERAAAGPALGGSAFNWMVYDEDSDLVVASDGGSIWTYDTEADSWSPLPASSLPGTTGQARYHPPSGLIVLFEERGDAGIEGVWAYDVDAVVRFGLGNGLDLGSGQTAPATNHRLSEERGLAVYDRAEGGWYLYQVGHSSWIPATWRYVPGSGWDQLDILTPSAGFYFIDLYRGEEIAFDEGNGRVALLSQGQLAAFDPTVPAWEVLYSTPREAVQTDGPSYRTGAQLVYDSANDRLIMLGGGLGVTAFEAPASDVWAYDMVAREWILLLAAE